MPHYHVRYDRQTNFDTYAHMFVRNLSHDSLIEWLTSNAIDEGDFYVDANSIRVYETMSEIQNDEDVERGKDVTKLLLWSVPVIRNAREKLASYSPVEGEGQEKSAISTAPSAHAQSSSFPSFDSILPLMLENTSHVLLAHKWTEAQRELQRALKAYEDGRMSDCCHNLRKVLEIAWLRVYEILEKGQAPKKPGTAQDIGPLVNSLKKHGAQDDAVGIVRSVWAYVTERDHIEKRRGSAPAESETILGIQLVFSTLDYLLTFAS